MPKKKQNINSSENGQKKVFKVWNHKYFPLQFLTKRDTRLCNSHLWHDTQGTSHRHLKDKRSWIRTMELNNTTRCEHSTKGPTLTFPFSYRWGGGGWGGWRETTGGIQQGAPLIIQSVALETREEVEKSILSNSFLCSRLQQLRKYDKNTVNNTPEKFLHSFNKVMNKGGNVRGFINKCIISNQSGLYNYLRRWRCIQLRTRVLGASFVLVFRRWFIVVLLLLAFESMEEE